MTMPLPVLESAVLYANTLLRLASLCLHVPRGNAVGLGIFDGENLETRIMMLTEKRLSLSRAGVIGLALATSITFGAGAVLAHAISLQAGSDPPTPLKTSQEPGTGCSTERASPR